MNKLRAIPILALVILSITTVASTLYCSRGYNAALCEKTSFKPSVGDVTECASQGYQYNPRGFAYVGYFQRGHNRVGDNN